MLLFTKIKNILDKNAKKTAIINCQLKKTWTIFVISKFPAIIDLDPVIVIEMTVDIENKIVQI
jgi:hypothetical protein